MPVLQNLMSKNNKIVIISPVHPYRGGIAQYTEALVGGFDDSIDVSIISFKRLYPSFLYPGKSDKVANVNESPYQKTEYILDFLSPFSWLKAVRVIKHKNPEIVIIAWWTFVWQPTLAFISWILQRSGIKTILLCHNVVDHESSRLKKLISRICLKSASGYIAHTKSESKKIKSIVPGADILLRPHPIYTHFPKPKGKLKKRGKLELLFFGFIRPYKGLDVLLDAMEQLNDEDIYLTIVGEVWSEQKELEERINQLVKNDIKVEYNFHYVSDEEAAEYFGRADVVVLPYLSATGSGVVTLAYNYGKPVLVTKVGGLKDVVADSSTGWLLPAGSTNSLTEKIREVRRTEIVNMKGAIKRYCKENSWDTQALEIVRYTMTVNEDIKQ